MSPNPQRGYTTAQGLIDGSIPPSGGRGLDSIFYHRVDIEFINSNTNPLLLTEQPSPGYTNYYTPGTPEAGVLNVRTYQKITYINLYKGIDLQFCLTESAPTGGSLGGIKYNFIIHPGADASQIHWKYNGAFNTLLENGKIILQLVNGNLEELIPKSFIKETSQAINVNYVSVGENEFTFSIPSYNNASTVVIDPVPWATYFGSFTSGSAIAKDISGNELITGTATSSSLYIATMGAYQTTYSGSADAFIAKFNPMATALLWATFYGGTGQDEGFDIATDKICNVFITGWTSSSSGIATSAGSGAYQTTHIPGFDALIIKFDSTGARQWGTYFGGGLQDAGQGIAIDANGNVLVTGYAFSTSGIATSGAYQTLSGGCSTFIAKFTTTGSIVWATYYGGGYGYGITTDKRNNVLVTGTTWGLGMASVGAFQTTFGGGNTDAFVVKFDSTGTTRLWGTYYGIDGCETGYGIATDMNENVVVTGLTTSATLMATGGAYQAIYGGGTTGLGCSGGGDAFVIKFNSSGARLWSTYYGGNGDDVGNAIATDTSGNVFITGATKTDTTTSNIASLGAYQTAYGGSGDAFVAAFDSLGRRLWGTYYGGSNADQGKGIALDANSNVYITGQTNSSSGISHIGAYQMSLIGSGGDAFVKMKIPS